MLLVSSEPWPRRKQEAPIAPNFNNQAVSISPAPSFCSGGERDAHPACICSCQSGGVERDDEEQRMILSEVPNSVLYRTQ